MRKKIKLEINELNEYRLIEVDCGIWDVLGEIKYKINQFIENNSQLDVNDISANDIIIIEQEIEKYLAENTESLIAEINEHAKSQNEDLKFREQYEG